jgi:hypothetical protein
MSQLFLNDSNVLIMSGKTKEGLRRSCRFWAERGLIRCEDSLDNSYHIISVRSLLQRVKALNDMLRRSAVSSDAGVDADLREELSRNIEKAIRIAAIAQEQGQPSDASARRDLVRRRPKTIHLHSSGNAIM